MNPQRATDVSGLPFPPDGRDVRVAVTESGDLLVRGEVPNGGAVSLESVEMQAAWLDISTDEASAAVATLARLQSDPTSTSQHPNGLSLRDVHATTDRPTLASDRSNDLILNDGERVALAAQLRRSADERRVEPGPFDDDERAAELAADSSYYYVEEGGAAINQSAVDAVLGEERQRIEALAARVDESLRPFEQLAVQVEQTGRLDLDDMATRTVMAEWADDTGWATIGHDPDLVPPPDLQRAFHAFKVRDPQAQSAAALAWDAADKASAFAIQTGNTVDDSIAEAAFTDARIATSAAAPRPIATAAGAKAAPTTNGTVDLGSLQRVNSARLREVVHMTEQVNPAEAPRRSDRYDSVERPTPQQEMGRRS